MNDFQQWIKGRLSGDQLSIRERALEIGVSHTTLGNWLRGTQPSFLHCKLVADHFGVRVETIRRLAGWDDGSNAPAIAEATLSPEEEALVLAYRSAAGFPSAQQTLLGVAAVVAANAAVTGEAAAPGAAEPRQAPDRATS